MGTKDLATLEQRQAEIETIKAGVGETVMRLTALKVETDEDKECANFFGVEAADTVKKVKDYLKDANKPHKDKIEENTKGAKLIYEPIEDALEKLREKVSTYLREAEEKRQAELKRLAKEKEEADKKLADARAKAAEAPLAPPTKTEIKAAAQVQTLTLATKAVVADKPTGSRKIRKFEIIDAKLVPREYCHPSENAIRLGMGKAGETVPVIPGVKIWDDVVAVLK